MARIEMSGIGLSGGAVPAETAAEGAVRDGILDLLAQVVAAQRVLWGGLDETAASSAGNGRWSPKHLVTHIADAWDQQAASLAAASRGEVAPSCDDRPHDEIHAEVEARSSALTWADARDRLAGAYARAVAGIGRLDNASLAELVECEPDPDAGHVGPTLAREILFNAVWHPVAHITQGYRVDGRTAPALALQESLLESARRHRLEPKAIADAAYNAACAYAETGEADRAIALLRDAFAHNQKLVDWSRKDPDLDSLRDHPAFTALYAG